MCGISGFLGGTTCSDEMQAIVLRMADTIRHRGPDDGGAWVEADCRIGLGQRRLSIIDLSPSGHQPMTSASGRYTIVFNGEIYNFHQVREEVERLAGSLHWRGHSDTEVLLAAFDHWGVVATLSHLNGMFAFAVWDQAERELYLSRDRMGEKPLYYAWQNGTFLFGSELMALRAHPAFTAELDRNALALFFRHNCIPAPYTIYKNVWKLAPASYIKVRLGQSSAAPVTYWSVRQAAEAGAHDEFSGSDAEAIDALEVLLRDAVNIRMISDVPLGSFLSGGIDSSLITALMQRQSAHPIRTFSLGSGGQEYDEAPQARAIAEHLGTDHTELYVTAAETRDVIPELSRIYDEPFADSSQIPTFLLAGLTRRHVTVAISGDGGDEVFGGYNRHAWVSKIWNAIGWLPTPVRRIAAGGITSLPTHAWDGMFRACAWGLPASMRHRMPGYKLHKLAGLYAVDSPAAFYRGLISHWNEKDGLVLGASEPSTILTRKEAWADVRDFTEQMMYLDSVTYLPDDILVKVNRACMAVSLEGRIPLLDHRLLELSWRLPSKFKQRDGKSKWILRQLLARYVPPSLTERPKSGFGVPLGSWLRGSLRDWAEALLDERRLEEEGFLNPAPIRQKWTEHLAGRGNWEYHLWDVLMFQAWLEYQKTSL